MHIVKIRRIGAGLGPVMGQMRTWLDHNRTEPSLFELAFLPGRDIRFRVKFQNAVDASAFARVFEGEMLSDRAGLAA
jgi:hypothetical protein